MSLQVKDYDVGFSVCLRDKVYVMQGEGGAVENELFPQFTLSVGYGFSVHMLHYFKETMSGRLLYRNIVDVHIGI